MHVPVNFALAQREKVLENWMHECRSAIARKFPKIDFDSEHWPIKTLYQTEQSDWHFAVPISDFSDKDESYQKMIRCMVSERILEGKPKDLWGNIQSLRFLKTTGVHSIFELTAQDCRKIEQALLIEARENSARASPSIAWLNKLQSQLEHLSHKGVTARLGYVVSRDILNRLTVISRARKKQTKTARATLIDRKIEALNDAISALLDNDPRLDSYDRVLICLLIILMCAPSRINEVLCMSIDDHITVEDYGQKDVGTENQVHSAHQMLLLTMKGSKGASWSAKPALLFMMELFHFAVKIIQQHGERSRTLVAWYLKNPSKLYLPPELEHLRGKDISQANLRLIWSLGEKNNSKSGSASRFFLRLKSKCFKAPNPLVHLANGTKNARKSIDFLHWNDVEIHLLNNVHRALAACRRVTPENHYHGDLSKMLCLFDTDGTPYLPGACNYRYIATRLKPHRGRSTKSNPESLSLFEKLGITMPVSGEIRTAEIDSHDPRRWLTTMALRYGEKLSEVLINLWANRFSLQQLKAYDLRSPLELAAMSQMPLTTELADLSAGLDQADKLSDEYGLTTAIVTVHHAGISVTSMDLVMQATEDRPVARTSSGIFIIYPSRFGVCVHPHHAMPCTNYNSCITCDNNGVVKGHLPTNEALRERDKKLLTSIVRQLETLATTHNRRLADDQDDLAEHMLALVRNGLNHEAVQAFAKHLIQDFHSLKHRLKDKLLVARLEEAFVASGYVKLLGDPDVASGAYLKYHNPTVHASPLLEMAIDDRDGGRDQIKRDNEEFIRKYPIFNLNVLPTPEQKRLAAEVAAAEGEEDNHDEE